MCGGVKGTTKTRPAGPGAQQAWQAMRILRRFTLSQLLTTSPLMGKRYGLRYMAVLKHCGYVRVVKPRIMGQPAHGDTLGLVRDTGPLAPVMRQHGCSVYDPNTCLAWGKGGVQLPPTGNAERPGASPSVLWTAEQFAAVKGKAGAHDAQ